MPKVHKSQGNHLNELSHLYDYHPGQAIEYFHHPKRPLPITTLILFPKDNHYPDF